jgi:hypothetical protein
MTIDFIRKREPNTTVSADNTQSHCRDSAADLASRELKAALIQAVQLLFRATEMLQLFFQQNLPPRDVAGILICR